jgi:spore coat protein H
MVVLSEIHYHPPPSMSDAEFLEITNAGEVPADLSGYSLRGGIEFSFPQGSRLPPRGSCVVCRDPKAFRAGFGEGAALAGAYRGSLDNAGEELRLLDAAGETVSRVRYLDVPPWPREADGGGASLGLIDLLDDADDPSNWAAGKPTPGGPALRAERRPLSLYRARHSPAAPRAGEAVKVTVLLRGGGPGTKARLHFEVGGVEGSLPLSPSPAQPERTPSPGQAGERPILLEATLPPRPAQSLVRYWFEAEDISVPPRDAPTPNFAYFVQGAEVSTRLPLYHLLLDRRALGELDGNPGSNRLWPATLIASGEVYDRVQVRYRGAWARTWPKKSWKVIFPRDHPLGKHRRLNWNSAWRDPAFIREPLAYEIYREAGATSLLSRMVRVQMNGEFWGLYVEVEQPKKAFLTRSGLAGATLYKAASRSNQADERAFGSPAEYGRHYTLESGPDESYRDLHDFCRGLSETGDVAGYLERTVDLPRFVDYLCAGAFVQNWDGLNKNHFMARDAGGSGKWQPVPWDLDRTLGDHWDHRFDVATLPLYLGSQRFPGPTGWNRVAERFFSVPSLRQRFHQRLLELLGTAFSEERLRARIGSLSEPLSGEAELDRRKWGGDPDWRQGVEELKRYLTLRREFLLSQLPGGEAAAPRNLKPAGGSTVEQFPVVLEATPFRHQDPGVSHQATRWLVRREEGSYLTPAIDETSRKDLLSFSLPRGLVFPRSTYFFRVEHVSSNGKVSSPSEESSFRTGDFELVVTRFDLTARLNRDVIADPGDRRNDAIDDLGGLLIEEGFDGTRPGNPLARGLPRDRAIGVHLLAEYGGPNALQLASGDRAPVRLAVVRARYSFVRFLLAGGGGDCEMPLTFEYGDGSKARQVLPADDWYDDNPPDGPLGSVHAGCVPALNNMGRIRNGSFRERNDPALFEAVLAVDPRKDLVSIVLHPAQAVFEREGRARFNLFAAAGVRAGE